MRLSNGRGLFGPAERDWDWLWRGRAAGRQAWRFKGAKGFYVRPNRSLFALLEAAEREKPLVLLALHSAPALTMAPAAALTERGAAT